MKCEDINKMLAAYLDEEVTPEERRHVEAHLASCQKCQEELRTLASTRERLRLVLRAEAARVESSPRVWERVRRRIESKDSFWEQLGTYVSKPVWRAAIPVAVVLIAIGALWSMGVLPGFKSGTAPVTAPGLMAPESADASKSAPTVGQSRTPPSQSEQPVEIIYVSGPLPPINPGGPTVEVTLRNVAPEPVVSLAASLELDRPFNFDFDVTSANPLLPDTSISARLTLIGGGFSNNIPYPLVITGTLQSGTTFNYTEQVQIMTPPE